MRVLLFTDKEKDIYEVMTITDAWYDEDILDAECEYHQKKISGLAMRDTGGNILYIKNVSKEICNKICMGLFDRGTFDLRFLDEYEYI